MFWTMVRETVAVVVCSLAYGAQQERAHCSNSPAGQGAPPDVLVTVTELKLQDM